MVRRNVAQAALECTKQLRVFVQSRARAHSSHQGSRPVSVSGTLAAIENPFLVDALLAAFGQDKSIRDLDITLLLQACDNTRPSRAFEGLLGVSGWIHATSLAFG
jgi:hypothetical protein